MRLEGSEIVLVAKVVTVMNTAEVMGKTDAAAHLWLLNVTAEIEGTAKELSPVLTGHNKRSITRDVKGLVGRVYSTSGYGGYLETGTKRMAAQPYFYPAYQLALGNIQIKVV